LKVVVVAVGFCWTTTPIPGRMERADVEYIYYITLVLSFQDLEVVVQKPLQM